MKEGNNECKKEKRMQKKQKEVPMTNNMIIGESKQDGIVEDV